MKKNCVLTTLFLLIGLINLTCEASDREKQRQQYLRAETLFQKGERESFKKELNTLKGYPLYPYLVYYDLKSRLSSANNAEVASFLDEYGNTWFGESLRQEWLQLLATRQNWKEFLVFYTPSKNIESTCHYLYALSQQRPQEISNFPLNTIWFTGKSLPRSCNTIVETWKQQGLLSDEDILSRSALALEQGNFTLANTLIQQLSEPAQNAHALSFKQWTQIETNDILQKPVLLTNSGDHALFFHLLQKKIQNDLEEGIYTWEQFSNCHALNPSHSGNLINQIAVKLAANHDPRAQTWLAKIPAQHVNTAAHEWRVRDAIRRQDWQSVLRWTALLPSDLRQEDRWIYWRARAWEHYDAPHKARRLYLQAAKNRSYYGFLAALRLNHHPALNHKTIPVSEEFLNKIANTPGIMRAQELYFIGKSGLARKEWDYSVTQLPAAQQIAAAKIAHQMGWHSVAILTAGKTDLKDDLNIRFPTPYLDTVSYEAQKRNLDAAILYSVIRQESAFKADAESGAGAQGLMQVLPQTANDYAVRIWKEKKPSLSDLRTPTYNIRVGSAYFNSLLTEFNGQLAPAIAAYNAGPGRVKKWLPTQSAIPQDEWIETIPYYETREYLQHTLAYFVIYTHHLRHKNRGNAEIQLDRTNFLADISATRLPPTEN